MVNRLRYQLLIPLLILIKTNLGKVIGFENTIRFLKILSFDSSWANYLIKRENSLYYKISKLLYDNFRKKDIKILDIGCGTGNLLKEINCKSKVIGIDNSDLNLSFARYFFTKKSDILIHMDVEKEMPFEEKSFNVVHVNDTFHSLRKKKIVINQISKVLKPKGILAIIHNHKIKFKNIKGMNVSIFYKILKSAKFNYIRIYSDELLYFKLKLGDNFINQSEILDPENRFEAYNILASKDKKLFLFFKNLPSKHYYFISPHLDDAVLSCGNLINRLKNSGSKVTVITVFSNASNKPYSEVARQHIANSGFSNAKKLFRERKKEDKRALKYLGVNFKHLDFLDAVFRKDYKDNFIYNQYSLFLGDISLNDDLVIKKIKQKLFETIEESNAVLLAPMGIGGHVDHVIVRKVIENLGVDKIFWEDFPYNLSRKNKKLFLRKNKDFGKVFEFTDYSKSRKVKAVRMYRSQVSVLFRSENTPDMSERYYQRFSA